MLFVLEAIFLLILLSSMEEGDTSIVIEHVKKLQLTIFIRIIYSIMSN